MLAHCMQQGCVYLIYKLGLSLFKFTFGISLNRWQACGAVHGHPLAALTSCLLPFRLLIVKTLSVACPHIPICVLPLLYCTVELTSLCQNAKAWHFLSGKKANLVETTVDVFFAGRGECRLQVKAWPPHHPISRPLGYARWRSSHGHSWIQLSKFEGGDQQIFEKLFPRNS